MMEDWLFQYNDLISTLDDFAIQTDCVKYKEAWDYTKQMINAHALAIKPTEVSNQEALAVAWAQFECTFDEEENNALLSLAGIVANLVNSVPLGQGATFHEAIEVAFARARGFSKEEALAQHQEWIEANPEIWDSFTEEKNEARQLERDFMRSQLQVIEGGKGR